MDEPRVSVIIINWNHRLFLDSCLTALKAQRYPGLEIVVVDNGSADGSVEWIECNHSDVRLVAFPDNRGFAPAINHAIRLTSNELLLSLNPDVTISPGFISALVRVMLQDDRIGIVAPKLRMTDRPERLDSAGLFVSRARRPYDRGQGEIDRGQYDQKTEIFGACGAAALYRRKMLTDLALDGQYFDNDFFAYYEDADLSWRAQIHGWRCVFAPLAVGNHRRGSGDTLRKGKIKVSQGPRLALRNRYLMMIKNDDPGAILLDLPFILAAEIPRLIYIAFSSPAILLGLVEVMKAWPKLRAKRRKNLAARSLKPEKLRHWFLGS